MRYAMFIDGGYFELVLRNECGSPKVDFGQLAEETAHRMGLDAELLRTYYYHGEPYQARDSTPEEMDFAEGRQSFFEALYYVPRFEVKLGRTKRSGQDGDYDYRQKIVDVMLSIDLVELSTTRSIDHAVLLAGDADFLPAVEAAKRNGVALWLLHGKTPDRDLWKAADERLQFTREFAESIPYINTR